MAGGQTDAAPGGGWGFSLIMAAEPQKSPSKASTTRTRLTFANRCRPKNFPTAGWTQSSVGEAKDALREVGLDETGSRWLETRG